MYSLLAPNITQENSRNELRLGRHQCGPYKIINSTLKEIRNIMLIYLLFTQDMTSFTTKL